MTEDEKENTYSVPLPKDSKTIKMTIDATAREQRLLEDLNKANQTIGALMGQHKKEFIEGEQRPAPNGDQEDTSTIDREDRARNGNDTRIQSAGSYVDVDWVKGSTVPEVIEKIEYLSKVADNKEVFKKIHNSLVKKVLHGKPISIQFEGSLKQLATTREKQIPEFCDDSTRKQLQSWNTKVRANRVNWSEIE